MILGRMDNYKKKEKVYLLCPSCNILMRLRQPQTRIAMLIITFIYLLCSWVANLVL